MFDNHGRANPAPGSEGSLNLHVPWLRGTDKIIQDGVGHAFVECPVVAILLQVHLQRLQFEALFVWDIRDRQFTEIGLSCLGAQRREFWTDCIDRVVPLRIGVFEGFEEVGSWFGHRGGLRETARE